MRGQRPDAEVLQSVAQNSGGFEVTHCFNENRKSSEYFDGELAQHTGSWAELLSNGLSFDLTGLAPGPAAEAPMARHTFGLDRDAIARADTAAMVPGPHILGGHRMWPVIRSQLALGLRLASLPGLVAIGWTPAQTAMSVDYFVKVTSAWLEGGPFPALGLTAFTTALDGGLHSEGLSYFTGQELRLEPDLAEDRVAATKLAVRLTNELVERGEVVQRTEIKGPLGSHLILEPSLNRAFVRVRSAN